MVQQAHPDPKAMAHRVSEPVVHKGRGESGYCEEHGEHSIELDCAPGATRPWHLIVGVCKGTDLEKFVDDSNVGAFFGHARWPFKGFSCEEWNRIQGVTAPRIRKLYFSGAIRYGTW